MAGLKELRQRRKSVASTLKVTSAMKMIAAGKLKKSQDNMIKARPYSAKIREVMQMLVYGSESFTSDFFIKRTGDRTLYILVTSDKGLCGGFNANIIKAFNSDFRPEMDQIISVGNKISAHLARREIVTEYSFVNAFSNFDFSLAASVGSMAIDLYKKNKIDRVILIYNRFESALSQIVVREQLLPVELEATPSRKANLAHAKITAEPSPGELFDSIFPRYVNYLIWRGLLESFASENAARMTTMDSATENATEMFSTFTLQINKARQAAITQEISEIVSGSSFA
ncbi:MAG TPA: ATP synthase F1 subunit gamma [Spirochaetota bacterium]|jgi:F-type H+-transporting ATPase subunit gamma|nr:ATP synthase F1 subunit gamma [Spirochaetota bacterium]HOH38216.1 ATP synthase F1 subunit gamma [Spirochaetota bacterium]HOR43914.1 ATP synthase F1 subunit gamma [Spirochaetota bacterium]HPJ15285.1 ATP synthase F1 subunit gamma [Spirochaetota bacterium]HPK55338.1 ATP synthase F1 subunit gamma [Spirochaetota bacterium]